MINNIMNMRTLILVIIYNKELDNSSTLKTLSESDIEGSKEDIFIVNNGPREINCAGAVLQKLYDKRIQITLEQYINNKPLSHIYNAVCLSKINDYDRFIILDDDTLIPKYFFSEINEQYNESVDLQLPVIHDHLSDKIYYPLVNKEPFDYSMNHIIENMRDVVSIGSGLIIYKKLLLKLQSQHLEPFDNRYALYGVDTSLFRRIMKLTDSSINTKIIISSSLRHSLSRTENVISDWRYLERGYDSILSARFYSRTYLHLFYLFFLSLFNEVSAKRYKNIMPMISVFFKGKHPRC